MLLKKMSGFLYKIFVAPRYRLALAAFGKNAKIISPVTIDGPRNIHIGNSVWINGYGWLAALPLTGEKNVQLKVGDGTYIGRFSHIYATSSIEIGRKVLLADKVYITDNLHGYRDVNKPVIDQPVVQAGKVIIGDGCWLGENVCIIGASVGRNSIVGANAVVTKDIPDFCMAVGAPAKIIKRYHEEKKDWLPTDAAGEFI